MHQVQFDVRGKPSANTLILVDGFEAFRRFVRGWNRMRYDRGGYYWIVYQRHRQVDRAEVEQIVEAAWELRLLYAIVIVADSRGDNVEIFNLWPYSQTHCGDVESVLVDWRSTDMLADRLGDFYGCALRVDTFDNPPFVLLDWDKMGRTSMLGFEGMLVNILAKKLNFSVEVITPPDNDQWGFPRTDGNSTGLMKLMVDETVHFGICSIGYMEDRIAVLLPGFQHYTSYIVFAVPSGRPYSSFEKLFLPFEWKTWYALFGTLLASLAVIMIINTSSAPVKEHIYGGGISYPLTNLINLLFGGPLHKHPKGSFPLALLMLWLTFTLVIRTAYQGSLYKYLQVPKNFSAPLTMDAIDKSGLEYYMYEIAAAFFADYPNVLARTHYLPFDISLSDAIDQVGRDVLSGVVLCTVDHVAYHNKYSPAEEFVWATKEYVLGVSMAVYYPTRTYLRDTFDRHIQIIDSTGLLQHWAGQSADYDFTSDRRGVAVNRALSVADLLGSFQILGVLNGGAVVMFALEMVGLKCRLILRLVDWLQG
ncbi:uncharacterized protein LOC6052653 [Culex quinquefasciatus]|uniref:uncharacterized protein LOC6052653 n=1 Tax=Culex quinquefasciatus TaxID=7176 RepID=UPI0018E336BA|nr:uncharacterized protein LOC6052653 [Culex quinquefasciatus]